MLSYVPNISHVREVVSCFFFPVFASRVGNSRKPRRDFICRRSVAKSTFTYADNLQETGLTRLREGKSTEGARDQARVEERKVNNVLSWTEAGRNKVSVQFWMTEFSLLHDKKATFYSIERKNLSKQK